MIEPNDPDGPAGKPAPVLTQVIYMDRLKPGYWFFMFGAVLFLFVFSIFLGRYHLDFGDAVLALISGIVRPVSEAWAWLTGSAAVSADSGGAAGLDRFPGSLPHTVIFQIRLPRIAAAALVGGGLSLAGCSLQGLFRNPLVSPDILGVASGAGFGAALGILISGHPVVVQLSSFFFGLLAVSITYGLGRAYRSGTILILVLSGIMIGALFSALLSLVKYVADPYDTLPAIVFWLMGSLASVTGRDLYLSGPPIMAAGLILLVLRWRINLMSLGDDEARSLGVDVRKMTRIIVVCATIITAAAVCLSGIIGWVGLVVPHIGRLLVGPDFKKLAPASALIGAAYMMVVDNISRTVFSTEIPLGILTAIIGAPVFAYLLTKKKVGWL